MPVRFGFVVIIVCLAVLSGQWIALGSNQLRASRVAPAPRRTPRAPSNVVCQPLFVCDIVLDPGETIISMATGDSVRWILNTVASGSDGDTPHVLVKPTDYDLRTNLIISTNRRVCYVILVSAKHDYQYRARFYYPVSEVAHIAPTNVNGSAGIQVNLDRLDYSYRMHGEKSFMPVRVMNDGYHTYIEMPDGIQDMPVVFAIGNDGSDTIVNFRFRDLTFIVDGVPSRIALVQGSGRGQRRVIIERGN
jgi:P-type conjugative transfer protein TrbG